MRVACRRKPRSRPTLFQCRSGAVETAGVIQLLATHHVQCGGAQRVPRPWPATCSPSHAVARPGHAHPSRASTLALTQHNKHTVVQAPTPHVAVSQILSCESGGCRLSTGTSFGAGPNGFHLHRLLHAPDQHVAPRQARSSPTPTVPTKPHAGQELDKSVRLKHTPGDPRVDIAQRNGRMATGTDGLREAAPAPFHHAPQRPVACITLIQAQPCQR